LQALPCKTNIGGIWKPSGGRLAALPTTLHVTPSSGGSRVAALPTTLHVTPSSGGSPQQVGGTTRHTSHHLAGQNFQKALDLVSTV